MVFFHCRQNASLVEVCDECGSGGHVTRCDFCPKVYHVECIPQRVVQRSTRRLPRGEWKCHNCKDTKEDTSRNSHRKDKKSVKIEKDSSGKIFIQSLIVYLSERTSNDVHGFKYKIISPRNYTQRDFRCNSEIFATIIFVSLLHH